MRLHERILAFVCVATAAGIVVFWAQWFYTLATGDAGSAAYRAFENMFPPSDFVLALLLGITARGLWRGNVSRGVASFACGMLCTLFALDLAWSGPGILYTRINPGEGFIVAQTFVLMLWLGLRVARAPRDNNPAPAVPQRFIAGGLLLYYVAFTAAFWLNHFIGSHGSPELSPIAQIVIGTFLLADLLICGAALFALLGIALWTRCSRFLVRFCAGAIFFSTLNTFTFTLLHPQALGGEWIIYFALSFIYFAGVAVMLYVVLPGTSRKHA